MHDPQRNKAILDKRHGSNKSYTLDCLLVTNLHVTDKITVITDEAKRGGPKWYRKPKRPLTADEIRTQARLKQYGRIDG